MVVGDVKDGEVGEMIDVGRKGIDLTGEVVVDEIEPRSLRMRRRSREVMQGDGVRDLLLISEDEGGEVRPGLRHVVQVDVGDAENALDGADGEGAEGVEADQWEEGGPAWQPHKPAR